MESLATALSDDNRALRRLVRTTKRRTFTEAAALSGRQLTNLSRTPYTMERHELVALPRLTRFTALAAKPLGW